MRRRTGIELVLRVVLVTVFLAVLPGIFPNDVPLLWSRTNGMSLDHLPYRDFIWEYPPLTLLPMLLAVPTGNSPLVFVVVFGVLMAATELGALSVLRRHYPEHRGSISRYWYAVGVPLSGIAYFRLDWPPVLLAVLALVAVVNGRSGAGAIAAGFAAKLWPVLVAVPLLIDRRYRQLAASLGAVGAVALGWYVFSPSGFRTFLSFRKGSGFQIEGVVGGVRLLAGAPATVVSNTWVVDPGRWPLLDPAMTLAWLAVVAGAIVVGRRRSPDHLLLVGGLVVALMVSNRLLSPQFMVWAVPFVAVARAKGDNLCGAAFAVASGITLFYLFYYDYLVGGHPLLAAGVIVRNLLLVVVAVRLLGAAWRRPASGPAVDRPATAAHAADGERPALVPT